MRFWSRHSERKARRISTFIISLLLMLGSFAFAQDGVSHPPHDDMSHPPPKDDECHPPNADVSHPPKDDVSHPPNDMTDDQVLAQMKDYLTHLNQNPAGQGTSDKHGTLDRDNPTEGIALEKKINDQIAFLSRLKVLWKIPEFQKMRNLPAREILTSQKDNAYFLSALAFHNENIEQLLKNMRECPSVNTPTPLQLSLFDQQVIHRIIQFRKEMRSFEMKFTKMENNVPLDFHNFVKKIKFSRDNTLFFLTDRELIAWRASTFYAKANNLHMASINSHPFITSYPEDNPQVEHFTTFTVSDDQKCIAIGNNLGQVYFHCFDQPIDAIIQNLETLNEPTSNPIYLEAAINDQQGSPITALAFKANHSQLAMGFSDGRVVVYGIKTDGHYLPEYTFENGATDSDIDAEIRGMAFTLNGQYLVVTNGIVARLWPMETATATFSCNDVIHHRFFPSGHDHFIYWTDLDKLCQVEMNGTGLMFDTNTFDYDPNSNLMVYRFDQDLKVRDFNNAGSALTIDTTVCQIRQIVFSPDGSLIATVEDCSDDFSPYEKIYVYQKQLCRPDLELINIIDPERIHSTEQSK